VNRNRTARQHNFATVPRSDIPRSKFRMRQTRKQAFNASELIPIMCEEVLPGDVWQHRESVMARLATPIAPVVDDMDLETFYFFTPNRITWDSWEDFITGNNTSLVIPLITGRNDINTAYEVKPNSVFDQFGILPQVYSVETNFNVLPIWAYFKIYNQWFRDENLQSEWIWNPLWVATSNLSITQGGVTWKQQPIRVNKRHDYFTSSLPFAQKGAPVTMPLGTTAPVVSNGFPPTFWDNVSALETRQLQVGAGATAINQTAAATGAHQLYFYQSATGLQVDLSAATAATINELRQAFMMQSLLELDARGGTRYVEILRAHFGVISPDFRLQRSEYLGGGTVSINSISDCNSAAGAYYLRSSLP